MSWTHAVLEVYDLDGIGFDISKEEMTDRIDEGKYAWCVVEDDIVVYFMPLYKILWIKFKKYMSSLHSIISNRVYYPIYKRTPWGKRADAEWDEFMNAPEMTEEEWKELFKDDDVPQFFMSEDSE